MVYLFKIVIFHGYVSHNQMVLSSKAHPNWPSYDVRCWCPRIPSSNLCIQCVHIFSKLNRRNFARNHCCGHASAPLRPHFVAKIPRLVHWRSAHNLLKTSRVSLWMRAPSSRKCGEVWLSASSPVHRGVYDIGPIWGVRHDPQSCFVNGMP
jgi:hypothetical protein